VPNWEDVSFYIESKEENEDAKAGYKTTGRIHGEWYSDTDTAPMPRPLPVAPPSPFEAPPVATNLVVTQIVGYAPDMSTMIGIGGSFDVGAFVAPQRAKIFMKGPALAPLFTEPSDATYSLVETIPLGNEAGAGFERRGLSVGKYWIKVVIVSTVGISAVAGHPVESITLVQAPEDPINLALVKVANDRLYTWNPGVAGAFPPETYVLRFRDAVSAALKRTHTVRLEETIPCKWTYHSGAGDQGQISMDPDGSIYAAASTGDILHYHSQVFAGDAAIEFEVDSRIFFAIYILDAVSGSVRAEVVTSVGLVGGSPQLYDAEVATGLRRRLLPDSRVRIDIRNGHTDYFIDNSFWMKGYINPTPATFIVRVSFISVIGDPLNEDQAFRSVRVRPYVSRQFSYTGDMANADFGSIPATVRLDLTQISAQGVESPIATITG
jgi:hypothetical protein